MHPTQDQAARLRRRLVVIPVGAMCGDCCGHVYSPQSDQTDPATGLCLDCGGTGRTIREGRFESPFTNGLAGRWGWYYADDTESPAAVLRATALYLLRHGFHQGDMFATDTDPFPAACTQGAVKMAITGQAWSTYTHEQGVLFDQVMDLLANHIGYPAINEEDYDGPQDLDGVLPTPGGVVADWNDIPDRTIDEVVTVLTAAADEWDRQHPGGAR